MYLTLGEQVKLNQQNIENELLEIFCLIEENTMQTKVQALSRYCRLFDIKDKLKANKLMQEAYKKFNK